MVSDFTSYAFMAEPFEVCDDLRTRAPLVRVKLPIIGRVWVTTTQAAMGSVLKDAEIFAMRKTDGNVAGMRWWMPNVIYLLANNMLTMDEPDHSRLRGMVDRVFRRDFIMGLQPRIQEIADDLALRLFDRKREADLVTDFARELPLSVICEMLGLAPEDHQQFSTWAASLTRVNSLFGFLKAVGPLRRMRNYLKAEIDRQRGDPRKGLIGELVQMQAAGEPVSDDELVAMVFLLLVAGHETTTHVISGGVFELLKEDDQRQWLTMDDNHLPLAVEELLRFVSAVQFTKPRNVRRDVVVEGVKLKKGDVVMAMIVAANSDPQIIGCPHQFDLSRKPNRHVSFGAGPHFCLGHQLARLEIACALKALFKQWPGLALAVPPKKVRWNRRVGLRAIECLPVKPG